MKAVILFNLGGPDRVENIQPFLFNLFYDPAIIRLPTPLRWLLAKIISSRRVNEAAHIYSSIGGKSPIVDETMRQRDSLQEKLSGEYDVYICMRYWHPMIGKVIDKLKHKNYDEVILLPLYPQYSTTTTGSFLSEWTKMSHSKKYYVPVRNICCYPKDSNFITASVDVLKQSIQNYGISMETRFLFSAHGLPEKIVNSGDPYPEHIAMTVTRIIEKFPQIRDWKITYQSKVGPLKWLEPSTEKEIIRAGTEGKSIAIVPISFVSEHSETLYELDIQYKKLAADSGVKNYYRIPTIRDHKAYIDALAKMVRCDMNKGCGAKACSLNLTKKVA